MKRREASPPATPERLARFVATEWPADDPVRAWSAACQAWLDAGPGRHLPFGDYGDELDVLRESARLTRERARLR